MAEAVEIASAQLSQSYSAMALTEDNETVASVLELVSKAVQDLEHQVSTTETVVLRFSYR